jgi:predicted Ser/Thr protein kinase
VNDLQDLIGAAVAPVKEVTAIQQMRERYKDFDDVRGEMESIMQASPALAAAARQDANVLDTVYQAAAARKGKVSAADTARRQEARSKEVDRQKEAAFVERPTQKAPVTKKPTEDEWKKGFVDHLMSIQPNGMLPSS